MGFDLTGVNPKDAIYKKPNYKIYKTNQDKYFEELSRFQNQKGAYFRNNVWWWRPLAEYVITFTKVINKKDNDKWHCNDCHLVDNSHAEQIANQLDHLIKSGHTLKYEKMYEKKRRKAEKYNEVVEKCLESFLNLIKYQTGDKNIVPLNFDKDDKLIWDKIWDKKMFNASYPFSVENVKNFADFCRNSGGFTIG